MKKAFFVILSASLLFNGNQVFAQKASELREIIVIEFIAPNHQEMRKEEIPINRTPVSKFEIGGGSGSGCGECTAEQIAAQPSNYLFTARAFRTGKNKVKVGFEIEIDEECKTKKIFTVFRNQETKLQLNCGVSLTAYYALAK